MWQRAAERGVCTRAAGSPRPAHASPLVSASAPRETAVQKIPLGDGGSAGAQPPPGRTGAPGIWTGVHCRASAVAIGARPELRAAPGSSPPPSCATAPPGTPRPAKPLELRSRACRTGAALRGLCPTQVADCGPGSPEAKGAVARGEWGSGAKPARGGRRPPSPPQPASPGGAGRHVRGCRAGKHCNRGPAALVGTEAPRLRRPARPLGWSIPRQGRGKGQCALVEPWCR